MRNYISAINEALAFLVRNACSVVASRRDEPSRAERTASRQLAEQLRETASWTRNNSVYIHLWYKCVNVLLLLDFIFAPVCLSLSLTRTRALSWNQSKIDRGREEIRICNLAVQEADLLAANTEGYSSVE